METSGIFNLPSEFINTLSEDELQKLHQAKETLSAISGKLEKFTTGNDKSVSDYLKQRQKDWQRKQERLGEMRKNFV